ncbi:hypothetical protein EJ07DRAFT_155052 [Lizonia empirigonia]|nr:hypothetical protein EJ07DRAFT_155052 [Lizonia empirigonia]
MSLLAASCWACRGRGRAALRTSWPGSEAGSTRAVSPATTQCNVQSCPWQVQANLLLVTLPATRHHGPCSGANNALRTGKSQSYAAENPARVANVMPLPSTCCLCCGRLGELPEIATPRCEPQQQMAVCTHLQRQQTILPVRLVRVTRVRQLRLGHSRTEHVPSSHHLKRPSHPSKPPSMPEYCPARYRAAMLPSDLHWLSSCLVCVSEAYTVSTMPKLLIVVLGPARTWMRRLRGRRSISTSTTACLDVLAHANKAQSQESSPQPPALPTASSRPPPPADGSPPAWVADV